MASSSFALACDALVRQRDRVFLERIAKDYNLSIDELSSKYLETSEEAIKVPRKYTKKPKSVTIENEETGKKCCTAKTSKNEACKFSSLKGEVFCLRHLKQATGVRSSSDRVVKEKKEAAVEPVHNHPIDASPTEKCTTCETYGKPFEPAADKFEIVKPKSPAERLAEILNENDSDSDESVSDLMEKIPLEDFEDDD